MATHLLLAIVAFVMALSGPHIVIGLLSMLSMSASAAAAVTTTTITSNTTPAASTTGGLMIMAGMPSRQLQQRIANAELRQPSFKSPMYAIRSNNNNNINGKTNSNNGSGNNNNNAKTTSNGKTIISSNSNGNSNSFERANSVDRTRGSSSPLSMIAGNKSAIVQTVTTMPVGDSILDNAVTLPPSTSTTTTKTTTMMTAQNDDRSYFTSFFAPASNTNQAMQQQQQQQQMRMDNMPMNEPTFIETQASSSDAMMKDDESADNVDGRSSSSSLPMSTMMMMINNNGRPSVVTNIATNNRISMLSNLSPSSQLESAVGEKNSGDKTDSQTRVMTSSFSRDSGKTNSQSMRSRSLDNSATIAPATTMINLNNGRPQSSGAGETLAPSAPVLLTPGVKRGKANSLSMNINGIIMSSRPRQQQQQQQQLPTQRFGWPSNGKTRSNEQQKTFKLAMINETGNVFTAMDNSFNGNRQQMPTFMGNDQMQIVEPVIKQLPLMQPLMKEKQSTSSDPMMGFDDISPPVTNASPGANANDNTMRVNFEPESQSMSMNLGGNEMNLNSNSKLNPIDDNSGPRMIFISRETMQQMRNNLFNPLLSKSFKQNESQFFMPFSANDKQMSEPQIGEPINQFTPLVTPSVQSSSAMDSSSPSTLMASFDEDNNNNNNNKQMDRTTMPTMSNFGSGGTTSSSSSAFPASEMDETTNDDNTASVVTPKLTQFDATQSSQAAMMKNMMMMNSFSATTDQGEAMENNDNNNNNNNNTPATVFTSSEMSMPTGATSVSSNEQQSINGTFTAQGDVDQNMNDQNRQQQQSESSSSRASFNQTAMTRAQMQIQMQMPIDMQTIGFGDDVTPTQAPMRQTTSSTTMNDDSDSSTDVEEKETTTSMAAAITTTTTMPMTLPITTTTIPVTTPVRVSRITKTQQKTNKPKLESTKTRQNGEISNQIESSRSPSQVGNSTQSSANSSPMANGSGQSSKRNKVSNANKTKSQVKTSGPKSPTKLESPSRIKSKTSAQKINANANGVKIKPRQKQSNQSMALTAPTQSNPMSMDETQTLPGSASRPMGNKKSQGSTKSKNGIINNQVVNNRTQSTLTTTVATTTTGSTQSREMIQPQRENRVTNGQQLGSRSQINQDDANSLTSNGNGSNNNVNSRTASIAARGDAKQQQQPQLKMSSPGAQTSDGAISTTQSSNGEINGRPRPMIVSNFPMNDREQLTSNSIEAELSSSSMRSSDDELDMLRMTVPGEPSQDYPIYSKVPSTSFNCMSRSCPIGYFGDPEAQCQVFHVCQADGRYNSFLCPNGTIFSQQHFVCVWWWEVDCQLTRQLYKLNDAIYCPSGANYQATPDRNQNNNNRMTGPNSFVSDSNSVNQMIGTSLTADTLMGTSTNTTAPLKMENSGISTNNDDNLGESDRNEVNTSNTQDSNNLRPRLQSQTIAPETNTKLTPKSESPIDQSNISLFQQEQQIDV